MLSAIGKLLFNPFSVSIFDLMVSVNYKLEASPCLSATPGGVLDRAIDAEVEQHKDFLRLVCPLFQFVRKICSPTYLSVIREGFFQ